MMDGMNSRDLDNHITGHFAEEWEDEDELLSIDDDEPPEQDDLDDLPHWDDPTEEWEYDETGNVPSSECEPPASNYWEELEYDLDRDGRPMLDRDGRPFTDRS